MSLGVISCRADGVWVSGEFVSYETLCFFLKITNNMTKPILAIDSPSQSSHAMAKVRGWPNNPCDSRKENVSIFVPDGIGNGRLMKLLDKGQSNKWVACHSWKKRNKNAKRQWARHIK